MNPLRKLQDQGQSWWIDNLTRRMVRSGELKRRVEEEGLRGMTSNPVIFHKAISGSGDYDDQIRDLYARGATPEQVYEALVTTDMREACDVLRPVFERSEGLDGYVSLEVSPHLARDAQASIREARHLREVVDRPNLMIKIPGTAEGVPAIEELLFDGINVNVTLLFAVGNYEAAAHAYMRALERRLAEKKSIDRIASVASFFLSRIDVLVDDLLATLVDTENHPGTPPLPQDLMGRTAVANARLAYQASLKLGATEQWKRLATAGAHPQRLLWASTSTKNPRYRDVMYVEPLIGHYTVNTLPDETIAAFADHGKVEPDTILQGVAEAHALFEDLTRLGIDFDAATRQLEEEGIEKFNKPFDALMDLIASKRGV